MFIDSIKNILDIKPTRTQVPTKQKCVEWLLCNSNNNNNQKHFYAYASKAVPAKVISSVYIWCVSSMAALD